ncbi:uncharacterized protein BJ212DRAFT_1484178 [Suillus subaureus]|uniref:Uncharacterized protein n=1 Tax=Suillus subaureus TaxID=48587 RepID=A0A9P7E480_9AGAM|nr:uncharacterized protein BJ212DRAFT_1484178 [Suillus subaureus]KAG1810600.1 hypothetical protein BJ212DRAFT_1484178 [Suillus subaureus]
MPPHAIASPKKKKSKHKGSDASGRAGLLKKSRKAAELTKAPGMPLVSLGLSEAVAEDSAPQRSGCPNAGTGGHPPKDSTSLTSNIPVNPQALGPVCKGQKGHSKVVPPPYSSLAITNGPALSINNMNPIFSMQPPGGSLEETNNPYVAVGMKVAKKCTAKMASDQTSSNVVPPPHTTFMRQHLDPALFEEDDSDKDNDDDKDEDEDEEEDKEEDEDDDEDEEKDVEREEDEDKDKDTNESQHQHRNNHPGFSKESLPSQPQVTCHLTPEFDFQYSHDEDDVTAQTSLDKGSAINSESSSSIQWNSDSQGFLDPSAGAQHQQQVQHCEPSDVLECHHKQNGQPQLPDPETLELLHQVAEGAKLQGETDRQNSFLKHTKGECHVKHTLEDPFLTFVDDLAGSITEVLIATLVAWDREGKQFEAGIWPEQKCSMAQLLYNDLSTWQSELKKTAISLAPIAYLLVPPASVPAQECATWIEGAALQLLAGSEFLWFGLDALVILSSLLPDCHIPQSGPTFHHIPTPSEPTSRPHPISDSFPDPLPLCTPHLSKIDYAPDLPLSSGPPDPHCWPDLYHPIPSTLCALHPARHLDFTLSQILDYIHLIIFQSYIHPIFRIPRSPDLQILTPDLFPPSVRYPVPIPI